MFKSSLLFVLSALAVSPDTVVAFLPHSHVVALPTKVSKKIEWKLAAEARNASEVSMENVGEYRDSSIPSSRTNGAKDPNKVS